MNDPAPVAARSRMWRIARCALAFLPVLATALLAPGCASADPAQAVATADDGGGAPAPIERVRSPADSTPKAASAALHQVDPRALYRTLIEREAARTGLPAEVAEAVMAVESSYNPAAIGGVGEIGLMQVLPSTARMLGFVGSDTDLAVPETNIRYGVMYLAKAWRLAGGDLCTAVMKYRAGHGESRFSHLSVNYCVAVRGKLAARGFTITGIVPVATFGEAAKGGCRRRCFGGGQTGNVNLAALNTKLSALVMQVRPTR